MQPPRSDPRSHLAAINPEAGAHPITSDPVELAAAVSAGERSLADFPYYEARYGERGRRFASSDSAWLVTLTRMRTSEAMRQVLWLGQVLSARGMPQYLLERHLLHLDSALETARPQPPGARRVLLHASRRLAAARESVFPQSLFETLSAGLDRETGSCEGRIERMGAILVSAVADESLGLANSIVSVESWAADAARFPRIWCDAVTATIHRAMSAR